jgi:hypothetical protein
MTTSQRAARDILLQAVVFLLDHGIALAHVRLQSRPVDLARNVNGVKAVKDDMRLKN